jgi:hypothetical protein
MFMIACPIVLSDVPGRITGLLLSPLKTEAGDFTEVYKPLLSYTYNNSSGYDRAFYSAHPSEKLAQLISFER